MQKVILATKKRAQFKIFGSRYHYFGVLIEKYILSDG